MSDPLQTLRQQGPAPDLESQALGQWLLAQGGLDPLPGLVTVAASAETRRVPWARRADWILVPGQNELTVSSLASAPIEQGQNLAGEERDDVALPAGPPEAVIGVAPGVLRSRGALVRAALMAAALEQITELSLRHARERQQFGRPIGAFQAVQAHLVTIAQQAALVAVAVEAAMSREAEFEIATAKVLAGRAAVTATWAAHQVHGAVGVTRRHPLSEHTRRLWAWRSEFGGDREWAQRLGDALRRAGPDRLYPTIAGGSWELGLS
jgi:acyl-CoA dehydrogenase